MRPVNPLHVVVLIAAYALGSASSSSSRVCADDISRLERAAERMATALEDANRIARARK